MFPRQDINLTCTRYMKRLILLLFLGATIPMLADEVSSLVMHARDGSQVAYEFADNPMVTYSDGYLIITTAAEVSYPLSDMWKFTYTLAEAETPDIEDNTDNEDLEDDEDYYFEEETYTTSDGTPTALIVHAKDGSQMAVSLPRAPRSVSLMATCSSSRTASRRAIP